MSNMEKWVRSCLGKKRYDREGFAKKVIHNIKKERGIDLYHYRCDSCQGFHLTKQKERDGRYQVLRVV
jgi:hypothetical protein